MTPQILKQVREQIRPSGFMDPRQYLDSVYHQLKVYLKPYSYRKFAEDLGFAGTTAIHQLVKGYRPLTKKMALRLAAGLQLDEREQEYFVTLAEYSRATAPREKAQLFEQLVTLKQQADVNPLNRDWLLYCSDWYHPVIREMVAMPNFKESPKWILGRLQTSELNEDNVRASLQLLERLDLIERTDDGKLQQTQTTVSTGSRVRGMGLIRYHQEMLQKSQEALSRVRGKRRNVSAVTVAGDESTLKQMNALIEDLQHKLLELAETSAKDEIYQLNIQMFPFTDS